MSNEPIGLPEHPALNGLTTVEVAHIADVPLRNLNEWLKRRLLPVPRVGKGSRRNWDQVDALKVCIVAALRREGVMPGRAGRLIREDADFSRIIITPEGKARVEAFLDECMDRALALHAKKRERKDLRLMTASFRSTRISRGECPFAGVCVKGTTLLLSEGVGGQAFAAEFPEADAQKLLGEMNKALGEVEGFSQTSIFSFGERESPIIGVVVGRPLALSISAGPKGAIVAQLTTEDFTTIRDALRASLAAVANPIEIVAEPLPENDPRREITLQ